jgi:hypothetical protein
MASPELKDFLGGIHDSYVTYAEQLHTALYERVTQLAAATPEQLVQHAKVPIGPAQEIVKAAGEIVKAPGESDRQHVHHIYLCQLCVSHASDGVGSQLCCHCKLHSALPGIVLQCCACCTAAGRLHTTLR